MFSAEPRGNYDLNQFRQEHIPYFDKVTFLQLKDAATAVLGREKSTLLAELFSIELKLLTGQTVGFQILLDLNFSN